MFVAIGILFVLGSAVALNHAITETVSTEENEYAKFYDRPQR